VGACALHRYEAAQPHVAAGQPEAGTVEAVERDSPGQTPHPQRNDQTPVGGELLHPRRGDVPGADGHDDPVVGAVAGCTGVAVAEDGPYLVVAGGVETGAGSVDDLRVDVHGGHFAVGADEFGDQRGVVAARPDLQHPHSRPQVGLLQHDRLDVRRGDGAGHHAVLVVLGPHRRVRRVGQLHRRVRCEQVPRHRPERGRDRFGTDAVERPQFVDHRRRDVSDWARPPGSTTCPDSAVRDGLRSWYGALSADGVKPHQRRPGRVRRRQVR